MAAVGYVGGDPRKVDVDGYTKGDVLAANASGALVAIPVGADANVLTADSADAEGVQWTAGGGGSGTPSGTVSAETSFALIPSAGVSLSYSRGDHTHGSPAAPITTQIVETGPITSGNISAAAGPGYTQIGTDLTVPAVAGDIIGVNIEALLDATATNLIIDAATRVAGADVNYLSTGTNSKLFPGARPHWYMASAPSNFYTSPRGEVRYVVQAGDLSGGNVTIRCYAAGEGSARTVFANASFPLRIWLTNYGQ